MKPLTRADKAKLRKDTKSYHVAAVLDKASSDRLMRPAPAHCEVRREGGVVLQVVAAFGPGHLRKR